MYLSDFYIINYRSCRNVHIVFENNYPNVLIGINDCGKSSTLQAIGLLLGVKPKFNFLSDQKKKNDISNTPLSADEFNGFLHSEQLPSLPYQLHATILIGKFKLEPTDINENNEESLSNHIKWVINSSNDDELWLARVFSDEEKNYESYLLTFDNNEPLTLYKQTATTLGKYRKDYDITNAEVENANNLGRFKNLELITAIYKKIELKKLWIPYSFDKEKGFWPEYRYLDWNFTLEELNQFANDVVNSKISIQIDASKQFAAEQATEAQAIVNQDLKELASTLKSDLHNIKSIQANIYFQVTSVVTDLLIEKENSDGAIHLDSQGDGVKRQLWFALLKWKALNTIQEGIVDTKFIWCFDEPETHLYPQAQREFFEIIKKISTTNIQSIISTHSTVFIDRAKLKNINKVDLSNGYTIVCKCSDVEDIYQSLQIRNSDFLFYDKFLVVEGETEEALIPKLFELHTGNTLLSESIQLIKLGGKTKRLANQRLLKCILEGFRKEVDSRIVYIFDNDAHSDFTAHEITTMNCHFVGEQDIEDSIDSSVWLSIINEKTEKNISIDLDDITHIKDEIPNANDKQLQANQKFYKKLIRLVDEKATKSEMPEYHGIFPEKGLESGKLLAEHIVSLDQVSPKIRDAFNQLLR